MRHHAFRAQAMAGAYLILFALPLRAAEPAPADGRIPVGRQTAPTPEELAARLDAAAAKYFKLPPPHTEEFHGLIKSCLDCGDEVAENAALAQAAKCRCFFCRRILRNLICEIQGLDEKRAAERSRVCYRARFLLVKLDLNGIPVYKGGLVNMEYSRHGPESRAAYLRSVYWGNRRNAEIAEWTVRKLAITNHLLAKDALVDIRKDVQRDIDDMKSGGFTNTMMRALEAATTISSVVTRDKDQMVLHSLGEVLRLSDASAVRMAAEELIEHEDRSDFKKKVAGFFDDAIKHHRDLAEKSKDDRVKQEIEQTIANMLVDLKAKLPNGQTPAPPRDR